jgi:hypothetical protein
MWLLLRVVLMRQCLVLRVFRRRHLCDECCKLLLLSLQVSCSREVAACSSCSVHLESSAAAAGQAGSEPEQGAHA